MNLIYKTLISLSFLLILTGCSSTDKIGNVGHIDFYKVHAGQFDGPNFTALVTHNQITKEVAIEYVFGSAGIGNSIIAAGGNIGASAAFGAALPRSSGDTVNVNGGNAYANSKSTSKNSNVNNNNNNNTSKGGNGGSGGNSGGKGGGTSNHGNHGDSHNHGKFGDHDHDDDNNSHKNFGYLRGLRTLF